MSSILCVVGASPRALAAPRFVEEVFRAGHEAHVILDEKARLFVGPSAFPVSVSDGVDHDSTADAIAFLPATTGTISRLANGLVTPAGESVRSGNVPVYVSLDEGDGMQDHPSVRKNVERLRSDGVRFLEIGANSLDVEDAVLTVLGALGGALAGRRVVVTAGGTREPMDSVRFIGNRSSGKMGLAVAREAVLLGAEVEVIAANIANREAGVKWTPVETVDEMQEAVMAAVEGADALVMAAAISDFKPESVVPEKIRRGGNERLALELVSTSDVLAGVREGFPDLFIVGFAATHGDPVPDAREKLVRKGADLVVGNDISQAGIGFSTDENEVVIVGRENERFVSKRAKNEVARAILEVLLSEADW